MELLTAVNFMLPKLGEHPVTSLDQKHPTLAIILPEIEDALRTALSKGWWFNSYPYVAMPDAEGYITLGTNTLSFVPDKVDAALRGLRLFNSTTLNYVWTESISGMVVQYVPFNELPETAAQYIKYMALVSSYVTDLGTAGDVQAWQALSGGAYTALLAEHLRNRKYSTARSRRFVNLRAALRA